MTTSRKSFLSFAVACIVALMAATAAFASNSADTDFTFKFSGGLPQRTEWRSKTDDTNVYMSNREDKTIPRHTDAPKAAFLSGSGTLSLAKTKESPPGVPRGVPPPAPPRAWVRSKKPGGRFRPPKSFIVPQARTRPRRGGRWGRRSRRGGSRPRRSGRRWCTASPSSC